MRDTPAVAPTGTLLVVDDDRTVLRTLSRILEGEGHRVHAADCPAQVRTPLQDPTLEVVLLDIVMGGVPAGRSLLPELKARRPDVEVVVMTGHASIEDAVGCIKDGAFQYLAKPFRDGGQLAGVVAEALHAGRRPRPFERAVAPPLSLDAYERLALERALRESAGDAVEAARRLGIGRSTLYRKLARHRLSAQDGVARPADRGVGLPPPIG